ncbi:hypothetical protein AABM38_21695 [Heyndrickxia sp. MSNUG]|uniref:hypothetical protein n=1 Tax=Heyndrickxia sp. MSNUG TaxID=3136677 RepID=UPI003C2C8D1C
MTTLNEENFHLVVKYAGLLETIEAAFVHMFLCFEELRFEEAKELWDDILLAFSQIDSSNSIIPEQFADQPSLLERFDQFEDVLDATEVLAFEDDPLHIGQIIQDKIFSIFLAWKKQIDQELKPYYIV